MAKEKRKSRKNYLARELKANEGIIPRFVAGVAFHTCAALGCGRIATPTLLVLFSQKSTEIHDTMKNPLIEGVGKAVILYGYVLLLCVCDSSSVFDRFRMTG